MNGGANANGTTILGGTMVLRDASSSTVSAINFVGGGGALLLKGYAAPSGFQAGDIIDLEPVGFVTGGSVTLLAGSVLLQPAGDFDADLRATPAPWWMCFLHVCGDIEGPASVG